MNAQDYEPFIHASWRAFLAAEQVQEQRARCNEFTALIRARNAARTPEEIARLERAKGLR